MTEQSHIRIQRVLFGLAFILTLITVISLPFALLSILNDVRHPESQSLRFTSPDDVLAPDYTQLEVVVTSVDEVNHTVTLRVNGFHSCAAQCESGFTDKVVFYQVDENDANQQSIPASDSILIPTSGTEISAKMTLPLRGNVLTYPFDSYKLGLGVVIERLYPSKEIKFLTTAESKGKLSITIDEQVARLNLDYLRIVEPGEVKPKNAKFEYANVALMSFKRPVFIQVVVSMVVLLTVAVAVYTMITRPFDQLVINSGAVILGVYGARSLVLSGFPSDVTLVDTIFSLVVLYNLLALTVRGMNFFHRGGKLSFLPWARSEPDTPIELVVTMRECPECLSKVPNAARRCAFCTSILPELMLEKPVHDS